MSSDEEAVEHVRDAYERGRKGTTARVRVVAITLHDDGGFTVRGTVDRRELPVVLRGIAASLEDDPRD